MALHEIALRADAARRLTLPASRAVLGSIVEATVALFGADAASIALYEADTDQLVFAVAAGEHGQEVVGLAIEPGQGVAGYVFSTGQPLALADVERDSRFGRSAAEQTGHVPRSIVAVPLLDEEGTLGVLEVLDKRGEGTFDLRDIELATIFARQATIAIRATRIERDTASLLRTVLGALDAGGDATAVDIEALVSDATADLDRDDDGALWALADQVSLLRSADPAQIDLVRELLAVLVRRSGSGRDGGSDRRR
jgi:GAF domain-containing protein